ncbi:MAG: GTPase obg [Parcubacteria group bacterium GW2011_GWF2_39_8b]|uniref:GTPase Obg n=2 Tax=Candidatus Zambryskiibacteriota TaxID=1817925 RepID=A0A1G2TR00_9BACT|nr:MAG: GTPase obg [Parcubacteria group bacterium GW2011_GWF2_39_8b]KKR45346.1 MAG: GTPase obg [Parcubacteria group bacterium GW2011_GWA2_40_14]OHA99049.1 MAG: Obg family GTPase CgtA [Candidatus Zambryskibacteria bacterium RIFCSPHIGHO2_12_FULL_38_37]OHB11499.1 MAG: Obg family GTPase CgtA [Candidatus Zambryskibacteria bacterium RIFCSPLOWO2_02_FULL_39_69]OHB14450.1 MAG: Obg family GTPase CgtA [Candidatus Zambryskibacteria bacterium RIFCSPLOWO2_12_FULL_39_45]
MFIDELTLNIWAGKGGDGIVSWMHVKGLSHAGPGGGDGGKGGSVYLQGVHDIGALSRHRFIKDFNADNGDNGHGDCMHGKSGSDITIELPIGSVVTNTATLEFIEVLSAEPIFFLKGGWGGRGNNYFKGSKNVNPQESTVGKPGEGGEFFIELKLMVDLGLIGLPNAGKSSILNALTKAKAKIGSYQFTTLTPNLGDLYGFIIADIPGLIHGASEGKGLGHKFLRHISRTKMLMHCISCENDKPLEVYKTIREELKKYDPSLLEKPEIILLTKTDLIDGDKLESYKKLFKKSHKNVLGVSIIDDQSVKSLSDELVKILGKI